MDKYKIMIILLLILLIITQIYYYYENLKTYCCKTENQIEKFDSSTNQSNIANINKIKFIPNVYSFIPIKSNKLYYELDCNYIKKSNDSFYMVLEKTGWQKTKNANDASLFIPCTYDDIDEEVNKTNELIKNNTYEQAVRIFMLNNSDYIVSKLMLWKIISSTYGVDIASTIMPITYDLSDPVEFKKNYTKDKIYILKNNLQRQEGLKISNNLDEILNLNNKYILAQELIQNPYCVDGYKINLRMYCLVIKDEYGNYGLQIYRDGIVYYTNEKFEKNSIEFNKNITTGYNDGTIWDSHPFTHEELRKYFNNKDRQLSELEKYILKNNIGDKFMHNTLADYIFYHIYVLLKYVFKPYINIIGSNSKGVNFQLYGADIAINDDLCPMLMEVNKGPDITIKDYEKHKYLKINLMTNILQNVGLMHNQVSDNFIKVSESVNINGTIYQVDQF